MTTDPLAERIAAIRKICKLSGDPYWEARAQHMIKQLRDTWKNEQRLEAKQKAERERKGK